MILVMDLAYRPGSLSADEFVSPVERIVHREGYHPLARHYGEITGEELESSGGVILCGTALADCGYLDRPDLFAWLPAFPRPVLGICAGMQVIARLFGGDVSPGVGIGMTGQEVVAPDPLLAGRDRFEAYELHSLAVVPPPSFRVLATSPSGIQVIRHPDRPVYGVMFHPEVRNEWLIRGFLALCRPAGGRTDALLEERD
jgi:GMP synthase-like glutamine amidotransferase